MKVIQLFSTGVVSGPEKMCIPGLRHINEEMAVRGRGEVELFYLIEERLDQNRRMVGPRYAASQGIIPSALIPVRMRLDLGAVGRLRAELRRRGADLLHCHATKPSVLGYLSTRGTGVRLVTTIHGWGDRSGLSPLYDYVLYRLLPHFDGVVNVCSSERERLVQKGIDPGLVHVIRNAGPDRYGDLAEGSFEGTRSVRKRVRRDPISKRLGIPHDRIRVATVSRLSPEKGLDVLLRAIRRLRQPERLACIIMGSGRSETALKSLAGQLGLDDTVTFTGFIADVDDLYPFIDVTAMPSHREGLPITLIEASFAGRAILATTVGGIPELIEHGTSGLLVQPGDVEALAHGLDRLVQDPELRARLGTGARRRALEHFGFDRWAREHVDYYEEISTGDGVTGDS